MMDHDDSDTEEDSGEPVPKRSRCDEEDNGYESSDDMHDNDMEYIFFGSSADDESEADEDEWLPQG